MDQARLRDGVGDAATLGGEAGDRGDVDDAPPALTLHDRRDRAHRDERRGEVVVDDVPPDLGVERLEVVEGDRPVEGGVVDEHVDPTELGLGPANHRLDAPVSYTHLTLPTIYSV